MRSPLPSCDVRTYFNICSTFHLNFTILIHFIIFKEQILWPSQTISPEWSVSCQCSFGHMHFISLFFKPHQVQTKVAVTCTVWISMHSARMHNLYVGGTTYTTSESIIRKLQFWKQRCCGQYSVLITYYRNTDSCILHSYLLPYKVSNGIIFSQVLPTDALFGSFTLGQQHRSSVE